MIIVVYIFTTTMYVLLADYNISLDYTQDGYQRYSVYRLKKYHDIILKSNRICVDDRLKGYDSRYIGFHLSQSHPNDHLLNKIAYNDTLLDIEVVCVRDDPKNIFYSYEKCNKISVYDYLTNNAFSLIPSKYGEDRDKYIKDNFHIANKLTLQHQDTLKKVRESKTVKTFIDEFNNSNSFPFMNVGSCNCHKEIESIKTTVNDVKERIDDLTEEVQYKNEIVEEIETIKYIVDDLEEMCDDIKDTIGKQNLYAEPIDTRLELTTLTKEILTPTKLRDNYCKLTHVNLLEKAVAYYNDNDIQILDIVEIVKLMLNSSKYILSDEFKTNKIDLKDIQFKFKELASPESITKDDILLEVFNIDNMVSLI